VLIGIAALIVVVAAALAITARLLVRRYLPRDTWFTDPPRAATTLMAVATVAGVMLAFVIFFALQSYQRARDGAATEATAVSEMNASAVVFGGGTGARLHGELVCYARAVIAEEWPAMAQGRSSDLVQAWIDGMRGELAATVPQNAREEAAYGQWMDAQAQRKDGRRLRLAEANASIPLPLWVVLGMGLTFVIAYMAVQADRRENRIVQAIPIGFVAVLMTSSLIVVALLDHPYSRWYGSVVPIEMQRTLSQIDDGKPTPCDEHGIGK
jgi:amino acid transporter